MFFNEYRLGANGGKYELIMNTDAKKFGGRGVITKRVYKTKKISAHGKDKSILIKVPKFTALYFKKN